MAKTDMAGMTPGAALDRIRPYMPALLLILLLLGISIAEPGFLRPKDLSVVLSDASVLFVMAAGMTFVIMLGGIDLSVQAGASFGDHHAREGGAGLHRVSASAPFR